MEAEASASLEAFVTLCQAASASAVPVHPRPRATQRPYRKRYRAEGAAVLRRPKNTALLLSDQSIYDALVNGCCKAECLKVNENICTPSRMRQARATLLGLSEADQLHRVVSMLCDGGPGTSMTYVIDNVPVCRSAWQSWYGVTHYKLNRALNMH